MQTVATALDPEFRALFEREVSYVCRSLRRLGVSSADEEDLAQEVFIQVHRRMAELDRTRPVRPWLFAFAVRVAANYRRLAHRAHEVAMEPVAYARPDNAEARDLVLRALASLDDDKRNVIVLHDLDGFAASEVAHALAIPVNTVYSRLRTARQDLSRFIERAEGSS